MNTKNLTVYKSNKLIEASYNLDISEQRIILACLSQCNPLELTEKTAVHLSISTITDLADTSSKSVYEELKRATERLFNRQVVIDNPDPDDPSLTRTRTRWVSAINYYDGEGRISLHFSSRIIPYLSQLQGQFTKYKLQHVTQFKSSYGVRLYELLIQWQSKGSREIEINWLRESWGLKNKYKALKDLKKWVIEPAMKDINNHSNLWVKFGQRKAGRRVVAFQFQFGLKKPEQDPKKLTKKQAEALARTGESYEELHKRLKSEGYKLDIEKFG